MSAILMTRRCNRCKRTYTYNPSLGDFGSICKHCHWPQQLTPIKVK